ncbi:hypothetical protein E2320_006052 [Naja naja]|nr:hypothetical protein E2320_006052 [Naja naja]
MQAANLSNLLKVIQEPSEPYTTFINRLQTALERQIQNQAARQELLIKLAFEHANEDCKKVLQPLSGNQACRVVGTTSHNMSALAAAITSSMPASNTQVFPVVKHGNCFNCGKPGHFKSQCRFSGGGALSVRVLPNPLLQNQELFAHDAVKAFTGLATALRVLLKLSRETN